MREIKNCYKQLLQSELKHLSDLESLKHLSEVGVYLIYENNTPVYAGETGDLVVRFSKLFNYGHTLSDTLLIEEAWKRGKHLTRKQLREDKEIWDDEIVRECDKEVKKRLLNCSFQCVEIEEQKRQKKAKLLERLVILMLEPRYNKD